MAEALGHFFDLPKAFYLPGFVDDIWAVGVCILKINYLRVFYFLSETTMTRSQAARDPDATPVDMEMQLAVTKEKLKMVLGTMEDLRKENEELNRCNIELSDATMPSHTEKGEGETHSNGGVNAEDVEKKKLCDELRSLIGKYEEM